jgi:hypothetical protein
MVKELTIMQMAQYMKAIGKIIKFMVLAHILGKMERYIQDNGKKEICMDKEYLVGPMAEDTKVNIYRIKNTDSEYILGKMEGSMLDNGKMANSMVKEYIKT